MGARRVPEVDYRSLVVLVSELLLSRGLFRNGLKAASALGFGARGAAHRSAFAQVTG